MVSSPIDILVLGIGNLLWADEGFGVRCVEALESGWQCPPGVTILDGGTQGLYLLPQVSEATRLLVLDAVDYGLAPGTLVRVVGDDVPRFLGAKKMSLHQTGFQEVLASAALIGRLPREMVLIGVQPAELEDFGGSLSPAVRARIPEAVAMAVAQLSEWGAPATPRGRDAAPAPGDALAIERYETGRPSAHDACRTADLRFFDGEA